ncbi:hypothetical protein Pcinc_022543 [Petrolisthes cinctipes]|uniref:Retinol dehydrogenase 11 n=1 Tax=Petrolisthes cinctipes TaxID=88211 RepID=A0AAE1FDN5_PETCI|nr:hypothetical protein Pcinc_022543 [Petrolisthes cinctipes]
MVRVFYRMNSARCKSLTRLDGKTVIVTGASAGIGKEAARDLARRGARIILACRNLEKAQRVAEEITTDTWNHNVVVRELDVSDLDSVRKFAKEILTTEEHLDILINNAGMAGHPKREVTHDGLELTMATNHYGHFLLTNLLLKLLKKSAPSRIIVVSSVMHKFCTKLDPEDLNFEKKYYSFFSSYNQSKLCNVLFTLELADRLKGVGVTANCLHPGAVATDISARGGHILYFLQNIGLKLIGKGQVTEGQRRWTPCQEL